MKVGLIGCGKLGKAFVRALLSSGLCREGDLLLVEREEWQVEEFRNKYKIDCTTKPDEKLGAMEAVILAVKPQDYEIMAEQAALFISPHQMLLSVMTGIKIARISRSFGGNTQIVRTMPNLPAQIGQSITPYVAHPQASAQSRAMALRILSAIGTHVELRDESLINAVTALSATGPGYVYEIISQMLKAAEEMGFTHDQASQLIAETFVGSIALWKNSGKSVEELRDTVKSKGGTTEAALKRFEQGELGKTLREGMLAAFKRAVELGGD